MWNRLIILILSVVTYALALAQTSISGVVKTTKGNGVDFASVVTSPVNAPKTILASAFTDENGRFQMSVKSDCDSLILKASSMEIAPTQIVIPNISGNYDIIVENRAVELKEVVVKSKKIYSQGDTINYNVASFLSQSDQSIADVLKKIPGISVSDAGQISYQGKPIKNLYIEGLDLMKGHYGIASNNLDLYDSEARWFDSLLGRTTTMDPLAEKYYSLSPYLWCAGNPVKFVDKVGKQPVKYIDDNGVKHIDWSIVVMVKALSPYASEKTIAKHERYKNDIRKELDAEFNSYLNGDGDGVKNGDGDIVISSFNIYVIDVDNTSSRKIADDLSVIYGQEIKDNQPGKHGKAAVFMSGNTNGAFGLTKKATYITISNGAPNGTKSHELYHTTGVLDNGYDKGGILNSPPEKISSDEVDMMWNLIPLKK